MTEDARVLPGAAGSLQCDVHASGERGIYALWRSWEALRLDAALGASSWMRDHMDYHMGVLTSATGPFAYDETRHSAKDGPLPHEEPPDGMFVDERSQ